MSIFGNNTTNQPVAGYSEYTDIILLGLSKNDDQEAFATLYERHKEAVFKHAYLFHQDYDKAQDVMQEVFVKLWEKRDTIVVASNFSAYLHAMVRRFNLNQIAHQEVVRKFEDYTAWQQYDSSNAVEDYITTKELTEILEERVAQLPYKMRQVFSLSREEQLSHQEISDLLHISKKTVRQQIYNALLNLKKNIKYVLLLFFT